MMCQSPNGMKRVSTVSSILSWRCQNPIRLMKGLQREAIQHDVSQSEHEPRPYEEQPITAWQKLSSVTRESQGVGLGRGVWSSVGSHNSRTSYSLAWDAQAWKESANVHAQRKPTWNVRTGLWWGGYKYGEGVAEEDRLHRRELNK